MLIAYFIGIVTGLLLAVIVLLVSLRARGPITRAIAQAESKLKEKGKILEVDDNLEELQNWVDNLPSDTK